MYKIRLITIFVLTFFAIETDSIAQEVKLESSLHQSSEKSNEQSDEQDKESMEERRKKRGLVEMDNIFVPKGQWICGLTASYSTHINDNYSFLVIEGINSQGYTFKASPLLAYAISNNMALGARFVYGRSLIKIDKASLSFGDEESGVNVNLVDYYGLEQSYSAKAIWRQYIPLGKTKRFALFNEIQLSVGGSQSKFTFDSPVIGTYAVGKDIALGISPGIIAFVTNDVAFEVSVGVMGISFSQTEQVHNQVTVGEINNSMINLKISLLSIGLGVAFYL